ncbi:MAG: hypothetical protein M3003_09270 [Candidatus Dormibacteraeota bacterium]|nr:hypothetical protein [Candidatus Dormibacteraeota bacterium]
MPVAMALAEVGPVPFWYVVEDASLTVTFWPVDVDIVKPDVDTVATVPNAPPDAGPDRALDPRPPEPLPAAAAEGDVAVAEDVPQAAVSPITAHIPTAAMIHRLLLFDSHRRAPGLHSCLAVVAEADESGEDTGG